MLWQIHIPNFKSISQKPAEKSLENKILAKGNNSSKSRSSVTKTQTWSVLCLEKFLYQISSQYLKRRQRKVRKTEMWQKDRQTDWRTDGQTDKQPVNTDSLTSREEKLSSTIPYSVPCTLPHQLLWQLYNEILQKRKINTQSAKMSQKTPFAFFYEKFGPWTPPPNVKRYSLTHPHNSFAPEVGLQHPPVVDIVSGSVTDNAMYILMQFYYRYS